MRKFRKMFWFLLIGLTVAGVFVLIGNMAVAQEGAPPEEWMGLIREVVLLLLTTLLIPMVLKFMEKQGLQISEKHRDQIQVTAMNAANLLLDPSLSWEDKKERSLVYMRTGAGDAMKYFRADPDRVFLIVMSYYNRMVGGADLDKENIDSLVHSIDR